MNADERRVRFRELHEREQLFLMPNPWDAGSARILAAAGFEALATTSAGFAWTLGKDDQQVTRDELVAHVAASRLRPTCRSTSTPSAAIRTNRAASRRPSVALPRPAPRAARSRTTTRRPARSTTSGSPPSASRSPRKRRTASPSRWCSRAAPRTTSAAWTTSTTRSPGSSPIATPAPTASTRRAHGHRPDHGGRRGSRRAGERARAGHGAGDPAARRRRRSPGLDRQPARGSRLRRAARGRAGAARRPAPPTTPARHIPRDALRDALGCRRQRPVEEKCIQSLTLDQSPPQPQPMALNARTTAGVTIPLRSGVRSM